jgi:hypothetical protein
MTALAALTFTVSDELRASVIACLTDIRKLHPTERASGFGNFKLLEFTDWTIFTIDIRP